MRMTEKMVEALLTVRYPGEWPDDPVFQKLDADGFTRTFGDACRREARNELEAAFAVAELEEAQNLRRIVGDPRMRVEVPIAAEDKESEVMPPDTGAIPPPATSPGVTAGASGLEPLDEIDPIALAELQQRADAALGDKSRWKIINHAPSPDEVERVARALYECEKKRSKLSSEVLTKVAGKPIIDGIEPYEENTETTWRSDARAAIAAMNRAPQRGDR